MSTFASRPPQSNRCDELHELLPAYIAGALSSEDTERAQQILNECLGEPVELASYVALTEAFNKRIPPVEPPAQLHDRLMTKVRTASQPATTAPQTVSSKGRRQTSTLLTIIAMLVFLLVATNGVQIVRFNQAQQEITLLRREQDARQQELSTVQYQQRDTIQQVSAADMKRAVLVGPDTANTRPVATLLWQQSPQAVLLLSDTLPVLDEGQTYQVWLLENDSPMDGGVFSVNSQGMVAFNVPLDEPIDEYNGVAITVEPAGGSPAPTGTPIASARF